MKGKKKLVGVIADIFKRLEVESFISRIFLKKRRRGEKGTIKKKINDRNPGIIESMDIAISVNTGK